MKWKLLLLGAVLGVAGCSNQYPAAGTGDFGFNTDLIPAPVQGLSDEDADRVYGATASSTQPTAPLK
jgi:hypothetical protein